MKTLLGLFGLICFSALTAFGQITANNWIDYNKTYYKFYIEDEKLTRIEYDALQASGIPLQGAGFQLFYKGEEVPIYVTTDGTFGTNDYIEFVGKRNDGEFDTQLYREEEWQVSKYWSLFTDDAAFFLAWDNSQPNLRYENAANDIVNVPQKDEYFDHTINKTYTNTFTPGLAPRLVGGVNNYFADFNLGEGFTSSDVVGGESENFSLKTHDVYDDGGTASLEIKVLGKSDDIRALPDHHSIVSINGVDIFDECYEGFEQSIKNVNIPLSILQEDNDLILHSVGDKWSPLSTIQNPAIDKNALGYTYITYKRGFDFDNDRFFAFSLENDDNRYIEIENFNGGSSPILYDQTNHLRIIPQFESGFFKIHLPNPIATSSEKRELFISNSTSILSVETVETLSTINFTNLNDASKAADFVMIYNSLLESTDNTGNTNQVNRYTDYRESVDGGSHAVLAIDIVELYDQFAWGIKQHPMSINNFVNYIIDLHEQGTWAIKPTYLYLMGKGVRYYPTTRFIESHSNQNLIPTFGSGSDIMLAVEDIHGSYVPQMAVGRCSARNAEEVKIYLDKVIEYEALQNDLPCDPAEWKWIKDAIHIAGGTSAEEAALFDNHLGNYQNIYEDRLMGGKVIESFTKATQAVTDVPELTPLINQGLHLITFEGHSGGTTWEFSIQDPTYYENHGKYPFMMSNSCFVGDVFQPELTDGNEIMSIDWTLAEGLGSIGFLATVKFGFPNYLNIYSSSLYEKFSNSMYNKSMAECTKETIAEIYVDDESTPNGVGRKITSQEFILLCDPALSLGRFNVPVLHMDDESLIINPPVINAAVDSFELKLAIDNFGKATYDSINVLVERTFPSGLVQIVESQKFIVPTYRDTISLWVQTDPNNGLGANNITVKIDEEPWIPESDCFDDLETSKDIFIIPNAAIPVSPCEFAIVGALPITLRASTSLAITEQSQNYEIQIDSSGLFDSPALQVYSIASTGGVVEWTPDDSYFVNGVEYFWRISEDPQPGQNRNWTESSFIYMQDEPSGWNQSDFYQYNKNTFTDLFLDFDSHEFDYNSTTNFITCNNRFANGGSDFNQVDAYFNGTTLAVSSCLFGGALCKGGIMISVFKPSKIIEPWLSYHDTDNSDGTYCGNVSQYGSIYCNTNASSQQIFGFHTGNDNKVQDLNNFLNLIPNGYYVLAYSINDHRLETGSGINGTNNVVDFFVNELGAMQMSTVAQEQPFIVFGKKGYPNYDGNTELYSVAGEEISLVEWPVEGKEQGGNMRSKIIGPSSQWNQLLFDAHSLDNIQNHDEYSIDIATIDQNGVSNFLANTGSNTSYDLSTIDAEMYPYLELIYTTKDTFNYTAPQLDYWRVHHSKFVDLALNPGETFVFLSDTLQEGEQGYLEMGLTNVMPFVSDSVLVQYTVVDESDNQALTTENVMYPPIGGGQTYNLQYSFNTQNLSQDCYLLMEVNPGSKQGEKFSFNNQTLIEFFVVSDKINPILDVTFDGIHILDGDIVSAKPEIKISVKDENPYLALSDSTVLDVELVYPDGTVIPVNYTDGYVTFYPASNNNDLSVNNEASIVMNPDFSQDGTYQLRVFGRDVSNNHAGSVNYEISFYIINQSMISNMLNYPNPFTTSTQFVFNLTGSEIPDNIKIQVMTVTGKVVREIYKEELGELRIGRNITEYTWDGTDQFGNELANGVYFYRVVASNEGQDLDKFVKESAANNTSGTQNMDNLFNKYGVGKMYKLR